MKHILYLALAVFAATVAGCSSTPKSPTSAGTQAQSSSAPTSTAPSSSASTQSSTPPLPSNAVSGVKSLERITPEAKYLEADTAQLLKEFGNPVKKYDWDGGTVYEFAQLPNTSFVDGGGKISTIIFRGANRSIYGVRIGMTTGEIRRQLGVSHSDATDEMSGDWYLEYLIGDKYTLSFIANDMTSPVRSVILWNKVIPPARNQGVPTPKTSSTSPSTQTGSAKPQGNPADYITLQGATSNGNLVVQCANMSSHTIAAVSISVSYEALNSSGRPTRFSQGLNCMDIPPGQRREVSYMTLKKGVRILQLKIDYALWGE